MNPTGKPPALTPQQFEVKTLLRYLISFPDDYESDPTDLANGGHGWPMLLFLHGAGERGEDLARVKTHGPPKQVAAGQKLPFIVVAPQCPTDSWWEPGNLKLLVESIQQRYVVDVDKTYCTGISMGGFGTWELAVRFPMLFSAVAPICGGGDPIGVRLLMHRRHDLPIWAFHGEADYVVPLERSVRMVEACKAMKNPNVKLTVYPGVGHDSWTRTYDDPALYEWLLEQKRSS